MCVCLFPNGHASSVQVVTTFASCKRRQVTRNLIFLLTWKCPENVQRCCRFMLSLSICFVVWRGDNKSGGWGDILCVCSDTRSHAWGPWVCQWDQQGWCEFSSSRGNETNMNRVHRACHKWEVCSQKMLLVAARTAAGVWCSLLCHHYWDTVKNRCGC